MLTGIRLLARELIRAFSYLLKIKIEFIVLNMLVKYSQRAKDQANALTVELRDLEHGPDGTTRAGVHRKDPRNNLEAFAGVLHVEEPVEEPVEEIVEEAINIIRTTSARPLPLSPELNIQSSSAFPS